MTNKLPVVGKRYRKRIGCEMDIVEVVALDLKYEQVHFKRIIDMQFFRDECDYLSYDKFNLIYEERPEDKAEIKPTIKENLILELSPGVKEAMEELRREIALCGGGFNPSPQTELERKAREIFYYFLSKSQNLLNALDKQFANNKTQAEEVVDNKIEANAEELSQDVMKESAKEGEGQIFEEIKEKEESIWKPVSELPENLIPTDKYLIKNKSVIKFSEINRDKLFYVGNGLCHGKAWIESFCTLTDFINDHEKLKERVKKLEAK